jgi:hypothetical protein
MPTTEPYPVTIFESNWNESAVYKWSELVPEDCEPCGRPLMPLRG